MLRRAVQLVPQAPPPMASGLRRWRGDSTAPSASAAAHETFNFTSDTHRVLELVTNSLYSEARRGSRPGTLRRRTAAVDETGAGRLRRRRARVTLSRRPLQKEIFLRELVSNAVDALEKQRIASLSSSSDPGTLQVLVRTDGLLGGTLSVEDSGCGFTREQLVEHLGTIARSGTDAFRAQQGGTGAKPGLIGRFGVGFYSVFMVAGKVEVFTRAADGEPLLWRSDGRGSYTIGPAADGDTPPRGTRVVLHLRPDVVSGSDLGTPSGVARVLRKHSSFVPHPVLLDGELMNGTPALWAQSPKDVSDDTYGAFYASLPGAIGRPTFRLHYSADSPLQFHALLFLPSEADADLFGPNRHEEASSVALYSNRVLIQAAARGLLPSYLRFVRGVVDCGDVPLNIGRESLQDAAVVRRLNAALTARLLRFLAEMAEKRPADYSAWYSDVGGSFIKEGVCAEQDTGHKTSLAKLLRYESTAAPAGQVTSLPALLARAAAQAAPPADASAPPPRRAIYYIVAHSRVAAEGSPYLESFRGRGLEVLLLYRPADEIVMRMLANFDGADCLNVEEADLSHLPPLPSTPADAVDAASASSGGPGAAATAGLNAEQMAALSSWLLSADGGGVLAGKVQSVRSSVRLSDSPALLSGHLPESLRRLQQAMQARVGDGGAQQLAPPSQPLPVLELNPKHELVARLAAAARDPAQAALAAEVAMQTLDLARLAAGQIDDPSTMVARLTRICTAALRELPPP